MFIYLWGISGVRLKTYNGATIIFTARVYPTRPIIRITQSYYNRWRNIELATLLLLLHNIKINIRFVVRTHIIILWTVWPRARMDEFGAFLTIRVLIIARRDENNTMTENSIIFKHCICIWIRNDYPIHLSTLICIVNI